MVLPLPSDLPSLFLRSLPPVASPLAALLLVSSAGAAFVAFLLPSSPPPLRRRRLLPALLASSSAAILLSLAGLSAWDELSGRFGGGGGRISPTPPLHAPDGGNVAGGAGVGVGAALITGASSGIGRSIAFELARLGVASPLVLVGRPGNPALDDAAAELRERHGASVLLLRADLSFPDEARRIRAATVEAGLDVRILVLCAGYGPTARHVDLADDEGGDFQLDRTVRINVESAAALAGLYGRDMADAVAVASSSAGGGDDGTATATATTARPRILIVSSIVGMIPGLPGASLYAATKSFLLSLGRALSVEYEPLGVSVTVVCPGATLTDFASNSGMADAALWNFPLGCVMDADDVARGSVRAMLDGRTEYIPGFMNALTMRAAVPLLPTRLAMKFFRFCWEPWPFAFPPGWRKEGRSGNGNDGRGGKSGREEAAATDGGAEGREVCRDGSGVGSTCGGGGGGEASRLGMSFPPDLSSRVLVVEEVPRASARSIRH